MAKLTDDQLRFIIDIEANGAQGQINSLSAEIGKLEKQNASLSSSLSKVNNELTKQEKKLAKMEAAGKTNTTAYKQLAQSVEANRQKQAQLTTQLKQTQNALDKDREKVAQFTSSLKLNQMTMQQLRERASQLRKQLDLTSKAASPETFKRLQGELAKTEAQMGKLGKKSGMVADVFKGTFGANMAYQGIMALFNTVRDGIGTITSFEAANASLASVLGTTQDGVKRLTADAKRLGEITEYSASQVTMMQTELAKLGFNETEILQSTQSILQFATATGSDIPEAAQLAGAALRAFGLDASEMTRAVSTMAVATTKSALDFEYLQNSMSTIAPVANAFGFSIEETVALLGTLANSGFDASSAATATRNILLNLADESGKLAQALGKPIKSLDDLAPALKQLKDEGVSLNEALELTDKRSVAAFETFLNGAETITTLKDSITGVNAELAQMQQTKLDTVEGSVKLLQSAWEGLMLQFYNSKGIFKSLIDFGTKIILGIQKAVQWIQKNQTVLKIVLRTLAIYLVTAKSITAWRQLDIKALIAQAKAKAAEILSTKAATIANEGLKKSLMSSPWGLIAMGIAAATSALMSFIGSASKADTLQEAMNNTQDRAREIAQENTASVMAEKEQLNALVKNIIKTTDNEKLRADLLKRLNEQYPGFLAHLDKDKVTNEELQAALLNTNREYDKRIQLLREQALAQAYQETLVDLNKKLLQAEMELMEIDDPKKQDKKRAEIRKLQGSIEKITEAYTTAGTAAENAAKSAEHALDPTAIAGEMNSLEHLIIDYEQKLDQLRADQKDGRYVDQEDIKWYENAIAQTKEKVLNLKSQIDDASQRQSEEDIYNVEKIEEAIQARENWIKNNQGTIENILNGHSYEQMYQAERNAIDKFNALTERYEAEKIELQKKLEVARKKEKIAAKKKEAAEGAEVDDKAYKEELKKLQDSYAKKKAVIIQNEANMTITSEESKRQQLKLAKEQADAELALARKRGKETGDLQIKASQAQMALNKDNYSRMEKDLQTWLDDSLRADKQALLNREMTQEEYDAHARELQTQHLDKLKALMEQYGMDTTGIEKKIADNQIKNQEEANKAILNAAKKARTEALKLSEQNEKRELDLLEQRYNLGLISETQYYQQRTKIAETYALARVATEKIYAEAVRDLDAEVVAEANDAVADATKALNQTLQDRLSEAREFTGELRDILTETAEACGDTLGGQLLGSFANAMDAIQKFQAQSEAGFESVGQAISAHVQMIGSVVNQVLSSAAQVSQQLFEMEFSKLEAEKQKELALVGDNNEERERIEQEYAEKELEMRKKQADADAAIQSAQLWVSTAMGIASVWATSMQLGPIAGPIAAGILSALLLGLAGVQQANILAKRDEIKNQTLEGSGSSSSSGINEGSAESVTTIRPEYQAGGRGYSDGGYTGDGGVHEPAGIVHKGEYVVSQAELRNPSVVPMVRAIEGVRQSRKHGRQGVHGFADGGYTGSEGMSDQLLGIIQDLANQVDEMKSKTLHADLNYHQFKQTEKKMDYIKAKGSL